MTYTLELIESKMDEAKNAIWNLAVCDRKLTNEDVKWLSCSYNAWYALKMVYDQMIEKETLKKCEMEKAMEQKAHMEHHTTPTANMPPVAKRV